MKSIGIIGYGIVGKATHKGLLINQTVLIHDVLLDTKLEDLAECEYVFFCIPTDTASSINALLEEIQTLKTINPTARIVIRSTLPVGTSAMIETAIGDDIYYLPEFLRERMWEEDCFNRPLVVGSKNAPFPHWLHDEEFISVSHEEAEVIKMMSNNMATARVTLANHFYELSQAVGADYNSVLQTYLEVNHDQNYLEVNEDLRGFGGKCLPKDLDFLIETFKQYNLTQTYFTAIKQDNTLWPTTVRKS